MATTPAGLRWSVVTLLAGEDNRGGHKHGRHARSSTRWRWRVNRDHGGQPGRAWMNPSSHTPLLTSERPRSHQKPESSVTGEPVNNLLLPFRARQFRLGRGARHAEVLQLLLLPDDIRQEG